MQQYTIFQIISIPTPNIACKFITYHNCFKFSIASFNTSTSRHFLQSSFTFMKHWSLHNITFVWEYIFSQYFFTHLLKTCVTLKDWLKTLHIFIQETHTTLRSIILKFDFIIYHITSVYTYT